MISPPVLLCTRRTEVCQDRATGTPHRVAASQMLTQHFGEYHRRRCWRETRRVQDACDTEQQACQWRKNNECVYLLAFFFFR